MKRLLHVDFLKGITLTLICLSHVQAVYGKIFDVSLLSYVTLPLFFFISGMLYNPANYQSILVYVRHKTRTLLIPYLALSLLFTVFSPYLYHPSYLVTVLDYPRTTFSIMAFPERIAAVVEWIIGDFICILLGDSSRSSQPLWFVFVLYMTAISFAYLSKLGKFSIPMALVSLLLSLNIPHCSLTGYIHIHAFFMSFFFYAIGFFYKRYKAMIKESYLVILFCVAVMCNYAFEVDGPDSYITGYFGSSSVRFLIHTLSSIFILLFASDILGKLKFSLLRWAFMVFGFVSRNGLVVIGVHFWALTFYLVFINQYISEEYRYCVANIFVLFTSLASIPLLNRYLDFCKKICAGNIR